MPVTPAMTGMSGMSGQTKETDVQNLGDDTGAQFVDDAGNVIQAKPQ